MNRPTEPNRHTPKPLAVLRSPDAAFLDEAEALLREQGWEVRRAGSVAEVDRLAWVLNPEAVVLPFECGQETGWLTCAKIALARPKVKVVLLATEEQQVYAERLSSFVGALAFVDGRDGPEALVRELTDTPALV